MKIEFILLIGVFIWLSILTGVFVWSFRFFKRLTKGTGSEDLIKVLNRILKSQGENTASIFAVEKEIKRLDKENLEHIQKVGVLRFNPFREMGGDHSFCLSLLDGENDGVIITCLHTRERTRVYMKTIKKGKSELELSEEEKKSLEKAVKGVN